MVILSKDKVCVTLFSFSDDSVSRDVCNFALRLEKDKRVMKRILTWLLLFAATVMQAQVKGSDLHPIWVGTWATAPQEVVRSFMPFNNDMTERSVRQCVKVSVAGDVVRLELSNAYGSGPVKIGSVYIAPSLEAYKIDPRRAVYLKFRGKDTVTIAPGKSVFSDAVRFKLAARQRVAITINYVSAPNEPSVHMGSRTTSYILHGTSTPKTDFRESFREDHWFNIAALDVVSNRARAVAVLGNSITDGKCSTTNKNDRWPDFLSENLPGMGVLNLGIGANCVLSKFIGEPGEKRFDRDILGQRGLKAILVFEGTNDLGRSRDGVACARQLIEAYRKFISKARQRHIRIYGCTILPFKRSPYYSYNHERGRNIVNDWIRYSGEFDGVIDFDRLMSDPFDRSQLRPAWQADWLHPNPAGYREMGKYAAERLKVLLKL